MRLVVLVPPGGDREGAGAAAWARDAGYAVHLESLGSARAPSLAEAEVVWCHAGDRVPALSAAWRAALSDWVGAGGRLLLSLLAAPLARALGGPDETPEIEHPSPWRDDGDSLWSEGFRDWPDYPHIRGAQGWGEHPLFDGLQRGTFTWAATDGEPMARAIFRAPRWPEGRVLAVDRAYVQLDAGTAVAWEYDVGEGRILCLGANVAFTARDLRLIAQRDRYLGNALAYLDPRRDLRGVPRHAWPRPRGASTGAAAEAAAAAAGAAAGQGDETPIAWPARPRPLDPAGELPEAVLQLSGAPRAGTPFTIAAPRALIVGDEATGVQECWVHPLCVLSEGLRLTVDGAPLQATGVRITPGLVERRLVDVRGGAWREVVAASPDQAAIVHEVAPTSPGSGASIRLHASVRLRLQWPHAGDALHPLLASVVRGEDRAAASDSCGAPWSVTVCGADGATAVRLALDGITALSLDPSPAAPQLTATSAPGRGMRLVVVATAEGRGALASAWRALLPAPDAAGERAPAPGADGTATHAGLAAIATALARRDAARGATTVRVITPAPGFDESWEWAKARLASFMVRVPRLGTGMVAGYAASRPGWGDSRPGYAWFFGRDACWCGDALLAAGMFDEARAALEFLGATADVTGKIAHEITTSGVAHYDAADSTPLWLRFVSQYANWTGDLSTVRSHWDAVRAAFGFVLSHVRDGDGLPANIGVGHGWVESGPLGGGAVTSYVAAIWIDALRRLAPLARTMGDADLSHRAADARTRAVAAFESRLRDAHTGRVALQRDADGRAVTDLTALSAVPILLGVDSGAAAHAVMAQLAADDYSAPWGVRMISRRDARYRPRGYHFGAVWPLFTGWAALAAFALGRADEGWRHLSAVASCASARERGAFDEVLDGDTGAAAGICPDQAWSAAMLISPLLYGMLGIRPFAAARRCIIDPSLPREWDAVRVTGLRVGDARVSLAVVRERAAGGSGKERYRCVASLDEGSALALQLGTGGDAVACELGPRRQATLARPVTPGGNDGKR